jgi:hypothetical protein
VVRLAAITCDSHLYCQRLDLKNRKKSRKDRDKNIFFLKNILFSFDRIAAKLSLPS